MSTAPSAYQFLDHNDPEGGRANGQPMCVISDLFVDLSDRNGLGPLRPTRSIYTLTRGEITRGLANRFVHSRAYIFLYLIMASLSVTTIVLSLTDGCPGPAFYILEIIINTSMILEVSIRLVALGQVSPRIQ